MMALEEKFEITLDEEGESACGHARRGACWGTCCDAQHTRSSCPASPHIDAAAPAPSLSFPLSLSLFHSSQAPRRSAPCRRLPTSSPPRWLPSKQPTRTTTRPPLPGTPVLRLGCAPARTAVAVAAAGAVYWSVHCRCRERLEQVVGAGARRCCCSGRACACAPPQAAIATGCQKVRPPPHVPRERAAAAWQRVHAHARARAAGTHARACVFAAASCCRWAFPRDGPHSMTRGVLRVRTTVRDRACRACH